MARAELYTSLTQLKMSMNGGRLPPMTPLTSEASEALDPAFTIGMGALMEDPVKGLRCPIAGCGRWVHLMSQHLTKSHPAFGGPSEIRRLLSIPQGVTLASTTLKSHKRRDALARGFGKLGRSGNIVSQMKRSLQKHTASVGKSRRLRIESVGHRNLWNICEAQLKHKFIDLHNKIGRSPSSREFAAEYSEIDVGRMKTLYGSWNNAKAHFGFETTGVGKSLRMRATKLDALALIPGLRAWHEAHGELPSAYDVQRQTVGPRLHAYSTYLRAFSTDSWTHAMKKAATLLQIYGGRYGIPLHLKPKEEAA